MKMKKLKITHIAYFYNRGRGNFSRKFGGKHTFFRRRRIGAQCDSHFEGLVPSKCLPPLRGVWGGRLLPFERSEVSKEFMRCMNGSPSNEVATR